MRGSTRHEPASGVARIAALVVLASSAIVAAVSAALGAVPGVSVWLGAGGAAIAALVAVLGPPILASLQARRRRQEAESATAARLARHLEQTRQAYAEHLEVGRRLHAPAGNRTVVLDRIVRLDGDKPESGLLQDFVSQNKAVVLLGEGGSGKTTSLLQLAATAAARAEDDTSAPIPIYIELKHFDVSENGFRRLFEMAANAYYADDVESFTGLWRDATRPLLFLLDGLNEQQGKPAACVSALQELADRRTHTYVVTSRPSPEVDRLLVSGRGFVALDLIPLQPDQIRQLLEATGLGWLWSQMDESLKNLAENPFMLTAIAQSCASLPSKELPRNVGDLYRTFIDGYKFGEREERRGLERYSYTDVKRPLLAWLAERMTADGRTVIARDSTLTGDVSTKLEAIAKDKGRWGVIPADWGPTDFLNEVIGSGILHSTANAIEFMHESVQEYFTACALANELPDHVVERVPQLVWRHVDVSSETIGMERDGRFTMPVLMLCGLVSDSSALLERIARRNPFLAARCVTAASTINPETLSALQEQWTALLEAEHERYRWIGVHCLSKSQLVDFSALKKLVDLAMDDSVRGGLGLGYPIRTEAEKTLVKLGLRNHGGYLAEKVVNPGPYDRATKLLIAAEPRLAVATLLTRWETMPSSEQRQSIKHALEGMARPFVRAELARLQRERYSKPSYCVRSGASAAL